MHLQKGPDMPYLAVIAHETSWNGFLVDIQVSATAQTREDLKERLEQGLTLHLDTLQKLGQPIPEAKTKTLEDIDAEELEDFNNPEALWIEPAPMNPISELIKAALAESGMSEREVARRMGTAPAAINRMKNPFYFGHSLQTLNKLAEVLGKKWQHQLV
ncbi:type II toxin-antitoxin system HicB family antitoxin [Deinococcus misasensis]|uniref:type II toxin-antitoxin system HicB family antitoxin n=1 Tax=Deinococcus misasensis TaxID=392413 RepID=UPI0012F9AD52|nr:type II toxin-antitoxin system HicB family antitoxin [Deinococcus misasensis]